MFLFKKNNGDALGTNSCLAGIQLLHFEVTNL